MRRWIIIIIVLLVLIAAGAYAALQTGLITQPGQTGTATPTIAGEAGGATAEDAAGLAANRALNGSVVADGRVVPVQVDLDVAVVRGDRRDCGGIRHSDDSLTWGFAARYATPCTPTPLPARSVAGWRSSLHNDGGRDEPVTQAPEGTQAAAQQCRGTVGGPAGRAGPREQGRT